MAKKLIRDFHEIFLDIYLIGYQTEGESIVCCLKTDDEISPFLFTSVIDCYRNEKFNYTVQLLEKLNISKLDLLCWTHPDEDHTLGIDELIQKYVDNNTVVSIPISLLEHKENFNKISQQCCNTILSRLKQRKNANKIQLQYTSNGMEVYSAEYLSKSQDKSYSLKIKALAPAAALIGNFLNRKTIENNIFSIALYLQFGMLNVLFTGDVENNTIRALQNTWDLPNNFHYIKIPHHGSQSSSKFIDLLESQKKPTFTGSTACSTVFSKVGLPDKKILKRYDSIVRDVICTSDFIGESDAAIIYVRFDIDRKIYTITKMVSN